MNIVVIGGSGRIGVKLVNRLRRNGHEVVAASPDSGVDSVTGEGLAESLAGAQVVVDVTNPLRASRRQSWNSSRRRVATFSRRKRPLAWDITSCCPSSAPIACYRVVTSAARWPKKN